MEAIADLIPFAIIVGFWLLRAIRGGKNRQRRPSDAAQPSAEGSGTSVPTPFEQLMRQLEDALEEPSRETSASDAEPVEPARLEALPSVGDTDYTISARPAERQAEREPPMRAAPRPPRAVPIGFDAPSSFEESFDHERHGFGPENPYSEESFENQPAFATRRRPAAEEYDPHALRSGRKKAPGGGRSGRNQARQKPRRGASAWAERLHDPAAAREALVLKTIFEGPWKPRSGRKDG